MSLDVAGTDVADSATPPTRSRRPKLPAAIEGLAVRLLHQNVLGVQLGVLLLILPMFIATIWLQVVSRGIWNHPPDSRYYLPMMSRDMGHPLGAAVQSQREISPSWQVAPWYFADDDPTWQMVRSRMLYPVLSIPFIWLFGLSGGSLAVPVLADILFFWVIARILQRLYGPAVAVIVTGTFTFVQPIFNVSWAGTDTLALAMAALIVVNLPIERPAAKANLAWLGLATILIALTRQVGVLAPAMAGAGWLWTLVRERSWRNRWLGSLVVTSVATLVIQAASTVLVKVNTQGIISHGQTTTWGVIRFFVHEMKSVTLDDISYMWHSDHILLALLMAAVVAMLLRFTSDAAAVFVGATAATYLIIAGVGFSGAMRYEMILFPAAAVAAGSLVSLVVGNSSEAAEELPSPRTRTRKAGPRTPLFTRPRFDAQAFLRQWTPGLPRQDRWVPQATGGFVLLAVVVGISVVGGSRSAVVAPTSPSYAAAQGSQPYAVQPLAKPSAETTLKAAFTQSNDIMKGQSVFDWTHAVRYRPTASDQPGWAQREADGTTVTRVNGMIEGENYTLLQRFADAITFNRTVLPETVKIVTRQTSAYGEDVEFTVKDKAGVLHRGTATTLYPIFGADFPGLITSLVFEP